MDYKTYYNLLQDAAEEPDFDMYVAERGWQEWMDEYADSQTVYNVLFFVYNLYNADNKISYIIDALGISQSALSRMFGIPLRSIQNWVGGRRECPNYTWMLIAYAAMSIRFREEDAV